MSPHKHSDSWEWLLAALTGGGFAGVMFDAFLLGFVGALGGLFCKLMYNGIKKILRDRKKRKQG